MTLAILSRVIGSRGGGGRCIAGWAGGGLGRVHDVVEDVVSRLANARGDAVRPLEARLKAVSER